jgi:hypothetical protein
MALPLLSSRSVSFRLFWASPSSARREQSLGLCFKFRRTLPTESKRMDSILSWVLCSATGSKLDRLCSQRIASDQVSWLLRALRRASPRCRPRPEAHPSHSPTVLSAEVSSITCWIHRPRYLGRISTTAAPPSHGPLAHPAVKLPVAPKAASRAGHAAGAQMRI